MRKIVLVSCVKKKLSHPAMARNMYISPLFRFNLEYAYSLKPDEIFILSAKYGLLKLEQVIDPYELTLNTMKQAEKKDWAYRVLGSLREETELKTDLFIFLAGENYWKYLLPHIQQYEIPFEGLQLGRQLQELKHRLS